MWSSGTAGSEGGHREAVAVLTSGRRGSVVRAGARVQRVGAAGSGRARTCVQGAGRAQAKQEERRRKEKRKRKKRKNKREKEKEREREKKIERFTAGFTAVTAAGRARAPVGDAQRIARNEGKRGRRDDI